MSVSVMDENSSQTQPVGTVGHIDPYHISVDKFDQEENEPQEKNQPSPQPELYSRVHAQLIPTTLSRPLSDLAYVKAKGVKAYCQNRVQFSLAQLGVEVLAGLTVAFALVPEVCV